MQLADAESRLLTQQNLEDHLRNQLNELKEAKRMEDEDAGERRQWEAEKSRLQARLARFEEEHEQKESHLRWILCR